MQPNKYTDIHANSGQTDTQTGITKSYRYRQVESKQSVLSRKVIATQARKKKDPETVCTRLVCREKGLIFKVQTTVARYYQQQTQRYKKVKQTGKSVNGFVKESVDQQLT